MPSSCHNPAPLVQKFRKLGRYEGGGRMLEIERPVRRPSKPETTKRKCVRCHGTGRSTCRSCGGKGEMSTSRNALGHMQFTRCRSCFGNRTTRCVSCSGVGWIA